MSWPIEKTVAAAFSLVLTLVGFLGLATYLSATDFLETTERVAHSYQVLEKAETIFSTLKDIISGARGYVLTGEERFLEPYHAAVSILDQQAQHLRLLTRDNPSQQRLVDTLSPLISRRAKLARQTIELRRIKGIEAATQLLPEGKIMMDRIRAMMREMEVAEERLLQQRIEEKKAKIGQLTLLLTSLTVLIVAILGSVFYLLHRHMTERKRAEAALARSNAELEQFARVASHDLQEPLRMVASYTQLLERRYKGKLDADADEFIAYAVDGAIRMQQLINDLLAYSRVGGERTAGNLKPVDCEAVLVQVLTDLKPSMQEHDAVVTHDPLPTVSTDRGQLAQVFLNLIGNALRYHGPKTPRIHVSALRHGADWTFSVRDNGIGIDPQYVERIFVIFQRLHTRAEYPGNGIGLAICKKIVEGFGGRIWVESSPGQGAVFYFTVPTP